MHEVQDPEEEGRTEATHAMNGSGSPTRPVLAVRVFPICNIVKMIFKLLNGVNMFVLIT